MQARSFEEPYPKKETLERILDTIPDGVTILDKNGRVTYANIAAEEMFGLKRRDMVGKAFHDLGWKATTLDGTPIPSEEHPFTKVLLIGERVSDFEHVHEYPDGRKVIMSANAMPVYDEKGRIAGAVLSHSDITKRKKAEAALKESEERFRATFEQAAVGVAHVGLNYRFIRLNQKYADIVGYTKEELTEKTFVDITYPEDIEKDVRQAQQLLEGKINTYTMEKRYIRKDGSLVWVNLTVSLVRDERGEPQYFIAVIEDISERKQAMDALRESERRFREMLEEADLVAVTLDTNGRITFANDFLLELTGWRREDVIEKDWFNLFLPPEQREMVRGFFFDSIARGEIQAHYENDIITSWGERRTISFTNLLLRDSRGNIIGTASIGEDVTERKRAAEEIKESRRQVLDILESITDGFFALDNDWRFTYVNQKATQLIGKRKEELLFRNMWEILPEIARSELYEKYHRAKQEMVPVSAEIFYPPQNRWFDIHAYPYGNGLSVYFSDITEKRKTEELLKDSEERYRRLVELSPDGIAVHSEGRLVFVNDAAVKMFGASSRDELIGKPVLNFVHPDYREVVKERMQKMRQGGPVPTIEEKFVRKDGTPIDVEVAASSIIYMGKPAIQVVFRDITERKRVQEALLETTRTLQALFHASPLAIIAIDKKGNVTTWNPAAERMFGWSGDEVIGRALPGIPEDKREVSQKRRAQVLRGEVIVNDEVQRYRKDGSTIDLSVSAAPIYDAAGNISGVMSVVADITERKRTEEALRKSEENYRTIFNSANDAIFVHNTQTGAILDVNKKATEMYGYSADEMKRLTIVDLSAGRTPYSQKEAIEWVEKAFREGPQLFEWMAKDRAGRLFWVEVNLKRVTLAGVERVLAIVRDISERKRLEEERLQLAHRMHLLLESTDEAIYELDLEGQSYIFNRAASEMTGYSPEEVLGKNIHKLIHHSHPDGSPYPVEECPVIRATRTGKGVRVDTDVFWRKDGTSFPVEYSSFPIIEGGVIKGAVVTFTDITRRKKVEAALKESESRYRSIFEDSPVSLWEEDFSEGKAFIDQLRKWGVKDLRAHLESHPDDLAELVSRVKVIDVNRNTLELFKAGSKDELKRSIGVTFTRESYTTFKEMIVALIEGKTEFEAETTRITLRGDRLYVALRLFVAPGFEESLSRVFVAITDITERKRAENELKEAKELSDALNRINEVLGSTLNIDEILRRVVIDGAKAIGSETAAIDMREDDYWVARYIYGFPKEYIGTRFTRDELKVSMQAVEIGRPGVVNDAYNDERVDREVMRKYNIRSFITVPLVIKGDVVGVLLFMYHSAPVTFTDAQVDFAAKLGASISLAIENARLYAIERNIADTLQEALLTVPKEITGINYGHLYRSATAAAKVGGDFYDIFELEHNKVGIVIGDVSGKGLEAATLTSLAKNTIKAYAFEGNSPAEVMTRTSDVIRKALVSAAFITVFFGILDIDSGVLTYCSAGHPPGILKRKSAKTELLITSSPVIGTFFSLNFVENDVKMEKGDTLILYTDGVTEARCDGEFFGEQKLVGFITGLKPKKAKDLPQLIFNDVIRCTGGKLFDDIALLAVSLENVE